MKKRLLRSEAVASLASELQIANRFKEFGWSTAHGSFFVDPVTDKLRETDVLAKRSWQRGSYAERQMAHLDLVVEFKSIRGYHLVFAPSSFFPEYAPIEREWVGYASERSTHQTHLLNALGRTNLEKNTVTSMLRRFFDLMYPEGMMIVGDLVVDPPPAPFAASAYRETNIGGQKDLSASVLWKAVQTLSAFLEQARADYVTDSFDSVWLPVDYARSQKLDVVDTLLDDLAEIGRKVRLFHLIVVVDSPLWALDGSSLREFPWCRFHRLNQDGLMSTWYDVVHSEVLDEYLHLVTTHYDQKMKEAGAHR